MARLRLTQQGFTLIEILVVVLIIGLLGSLAGVSWFSLLNEQRMRSGVNEAMSAMRLAQAGARRENLRWTVAFRTHDNQVQWTVNRATMPVTQWQWQNLLENDADKIEIVPSQTTLPLIDGSYRLTYEFNGRVAITHTPPQQITFRPKGNTAVGSQRCVQVVTLLGTIRSRRGADCS
ncbi:prepilin-type N-terminal cleavage/methylation domain-containing protein [Thermosynechococcus sp. CL-1]|nr:prepilin-type N-terminal cleavage/methylation domain-containing protein [Thermosynechococcus sp. CL-1]